MSSSQRGRAQHMRRGSDKFERTSTNCFTAPGHHCPCVSGVTRRALCLIAPSTPALERRGAWTAGGELASPRVEGWSSF